MPPAPEHASSTDVTTDGKGLPKYARVAAAVRAQIAAGTLLPGQPAPSGAALSRATGFSTLTCRRALRQLVADGVLTPGPSGSARPRVAGAPQLPAERDLVAAGRALSAALAARRRADGLTQPELAALTKISVTTIGHAETGRVWQSRQFWERADAALRAGGELLRLHDAYRRAAAAGPAPTAADRLLPADPGIPLPRGHATPSRAFPGGAAPAGDSWPPAGRSPGARGQAVPGQGAAGQAGPAWVTIVWGDGTVTTVHPPQTSAPDTPAGRPEASSGGAFPG